MFYIKINDLKRHVKNLIKVNDLIQHGKNDKKKLLKLLVLPFEAIQFKRLVIRVE